MFNGSIPKANNEGKSRDADWVIKQQEFCNIRTCRKKIEHDISGGRLYGKGRIILCMRIFWSTPQALRIVLVCDNFKGETAAHPSLFDESQPQSIHGITSDVLKDKKKLNTALGVVNLIQFLALMTVFYLLLDLFPCRWLIFFCASSSYKAALILFHCP